MGDLFNSLWLRSRNITSDNRHQYITIYHSTLKEEYFQFLTNIPGLIECDCLYLTTFRRVYFSVHVNHD